MTGINYFVEHLFLSPAPFYPRNTTGFLTYSFVDVLMLVVVLKRDTVKPQLDYNHQSALVMTTILVSEEHELYRRIGIADSENQNALESDLPRLLVLSCSSDCFTPLTSQFVNTLARYCLIPFHF